MVIRAPRLLTSEYVNSRLKPETVKSKEGCNRLGDLQWTVLTYISVLLIKYNACTAFKFIIFHHAQKVILILLILTQKTLLTIRLSWICVANQAVFSRKIKRTGPDE